MAVVALVGASATAARADVDLSLKDAIDLARERRAELAEAKIEVERAKLQQLAARLAYFEVRITGRGAAGYEAGNAEIYAPQAACALSGTGCPPGIYDAAIDSTLEIPIFSGLRLESKLSEARWRNVSAAERERAATLGIVVDVTRAYWAVRRAELLRDAVATELGQFREIEQLTQHQVAVGIAPAFDFNRVRAETLSSEARLRGAERELGIARAQLGAALQVDEPVRPIDNPPTNAPEIPTREQAEQQALKAHPELLAAQADVHASIAQLRAAKSVFWPQLSLVAESSVGGGSVPRGYYAQTPSGPNGMGTSPPSPSYWAGIFAGAQLTWSIFDFNNIVQTREAALAQHSAEIERARQRYRVLAEVRAAHAQLSLAWQQVVPIRQAVALARSNVDLARRRYSAGAARLFEVLDVQRELVRLEQELIDSTVAVAEADVQFRAALGSP
jgi:outer membrane protein